MQLKLEGTIIECKLFFLNKTVLFQDGIHPK